MRRNAVIAVLFAALAAGTVAMSLSMRGGMPMPGGWTMAMTWMRMPGQSLFAAWLMFMAMWSLMMSAMMLPCLGIFLARYHGSMRGTMAVGATYLLVWIAAGLVVYPIGIAITGAEMRWPALARAVPLATVAVLVIAGAVQLTSWKTRQIVRCCDLSADDSPWRYGARLGLRCGACCATFMIALLVTGMMSVIGMTAATIAITLERVAPRPQVAARLFGVALIVLAFL